MDSAIKDEEWMQNRLDLEKAAIMQERNRFTDAMTQDILSAKQKMLNDSWSKLQDIVASDPDNAQFYKQICPQLFTSLSTKFPKKRFSKRTTLPKFPNQNLTKINAGESKIISDICGIRQNTGQNSVPIREGRLLLVTQTGQKWVVDITEFKPHVYSLRYCDGSCSQLHSDEIKTLGIKFMELPSK